MPKSPLPLDRLLKPLVVVLIVVVCGPEVFALIELTTLLELLGATLFLFAFATSFKMLAYSMLRWLGRALLPPEYAALIRTRAWPSAVVHFLRNGVMWLMVCVVPFMMLSDLLSRS